MAQSKSKRGRSPEKGKAEKKRKTNNKPAFPIQAIHQLLEQKFSGGVVKPEAAIFFSSIVEYVGAELIELSLNVARTAGRGETGAIKVTAEDVDAAIEGDRELNELISRVRKQPGT